MAPSVRQPNGDCDVDTNGHHSRRSKELTVLLTGFGPFQDKFPVNPSFEIARRLPEKLPATSMHSSPVRIISYGQPIRVAYNEVRELVPRLHQEYRGTVDVVLHIGMASGRSYYCIERCGHRDGYTKNKDLDGIIPPKDEGETLFPDCPSTMTTSLDYHNILLNWDVNLISTPAGSPGHRAEIRASDDPGHYLCDYIYFNSLATSARRSGNFESTNDESRPVLFLHVPAESGGDMIEKGVVVTQALIRAIVDNIAKKRQEASASS